MSLLFRHLRIHQIFGANTDVGKTVFATALVRASASGGENVFYLKPVSTGPLKDADDRYVSAYTAMISKRRFDKIGLGDISKSCLFQFGEPISPHLAAKDEGADVSDETLIRSITEHIQRQSRAPSPLRSSMFVETAGGVHSPVPSGATQVDAYRPLFLPTILVGDSKLGGISSTISAYESLTLRGYIVDSVLLFRDDYYRNWEYLRSYFAERGVHVSCFIPPPARIENKEAEQVSMNAYYDRLMDASEDNDGMYTAIDHLQDRHESRLGELDSMAQRSMDALWWPFVQHGLVRSTDDVTVIDSAFGDFFNVYATAQAETSPEVGSSSLLRPQFDGSASWWTQAFGHTHPLLTIAAAGAAGRYGHVMFPEATHSPALRLAETLLQSGPGRGWASRVFYSDDGSTGMEVALKMALRAYSVQQKSSGKAVQRELGVIGLKGSYHGDTIGAMDACEEGVYSCEWHNAKGFWFDPPSVSIRNGKAIVSLPGPIADAAGSSGTVELGTVSAVYDVESRLASPLAEVYRDYVKRQLTRLQAGDGLEPAALVLEPLVLGAGGMVFVDPVFQRILVDAVREPSSASKRPHHGLPVIFDEVFVGLHRLGMPSCAPLLGVTPDIAVYAKMLTGGLVPLAVTLASDRIFRAFVSNSKADALLHGHSYTAHAIGCEVANKSLDILQQLEASNAWAAAKRLWNDKAPSSSSTIWSLWNPEFVDAVSSLESVEETMAIGTVFVLKVRDSGGYVSHSAKDLLAGIRSALTGKDGSFAPDGSPFGIHFRTLGDVAYFMTSVTTPLSTIKSVEDRIWKALQSKG